MTMKVYVDNNEKNCNDENGRVAHLKKIIAKKPDELQGPIWVNIDSDLMFEMDGYRVATELKEAGDLLASCTRNHFRRQIQNLSIQADVPAFVTVLGSPGDVRLHQRSIRKKKGLMNAQDLDREWDLVMSQCITSHAEYNIPVMFWDVDPMKWTISLAKHMMTGGKFPQFKPKTNSARIPQSMLEECPGVGPEMANALIRQFGTIKNLCRAKPEDIFAVKYGGRRPSKIGVRGELLVKALGIV